MKPKNQIMPIEKGLAAKIYLSAYERPKSGYEIAKEIYEHDHHRVRSIIKELAKEGYFIPISKDEWRHPKWLSNVEPLINRIQEIKDRENITLTDFDKYVLRKMLDSQAFRYLVRETKPNDLREKSVDAVDTILNWFEMIITINEIMVPPAQGTQEIKTVQQYENVISKMREVSPAVMDELEQDPQLSRPIKLARESKELFNDAIYLFIIPKSLLGKYKIISSFGEKYEEAKMLMQELNISWTIGKQGYGDFKIRKVEKER